MRWSLKNRHVGNWWKKWAWRPRYCAECEQTVWLEWMYRHGKAWKCPSCVTMEQLKGQEERESMDDMLQKIMTSGGYPVQSMPKTYGGSGIGGGNVGQAPQNYGIVPHTISTTLQQQGPQAASNGNIPQAYHTATVRTSKTRKAAR